MRKLLILIAAGILVLGFSAPALAEPCMAPDGWVGSCFAPVFHTNGDKAVFVGKGTRWEADDACEYGDKFLIKWKCKGKAVKKDNWISAPSWDFRQICTCNTPGRVLWLLGHDSAHGWYSFDARTGKCKKNKLKKLTFKLKKAGPYGLPVVAYLRLDQKEEPWERTEGNDGCDF